jgi:hypothetical protein
MLCWREDGRMGCIIQATRPAAGKNADDETGISLIAINAIVLVALTVVESRAASQ